MPSKQRSRVRLKAAATGGGLVFAGDVNLRCKALHDETGAALWEINLDLPVSRFRRPTRSTGTGTWSRALARATTGRAGAR